MTKSYSGSTSAASVTALDASAVVVDVVLVVVVLDNDCSVWEMPTPVSSSLLAQSSIGAIYVLWCLVR